MESAQAAVRAANRLKAGQAPTADQLRIADPEVLASEIRVAMALPSARKERSQNADGSVGRPSEYSEEEGQQICEWIQDGESLQKYCEVTNRKPATIYRWLMRDEKFRAAYAHAMENRADTLVDQMLGIADGCLPTSMEAVKKAELQINTRKWCAERMRPSKWGLQQSVGPTQPITFNIGISREPMRTLEHTPSTGEPALPQLTITSTTESDR